MNRSGTKRPSNLVFSLRIHHFSTRLRDQSESSLEQLLKSSMFLSVESSRKEDLLLWQVIQSQMHRLFRKLMLDLPWDQDVMLLKTTLTWLSLITTSFQFIKHAFGEDKRLIMSENSFSFNLLLTSWSASSQSLVEQQQDKYHSMSSKCFGPIWSWISSVQWLFAQNHHLLTSRSKYQHKESAEETRSWTHTSGDRSSHSRPINLLSCLFLCTLVHSCSSLSHSISSHKKTEMPMAIQTADLCWIQSCSTLSSLWIGSISLVAESMTAKIQTSSSASCTTHSSWSSPPLSFSSLTWW